MSGRSTEQTPGGEDTATRGDVAAVRLRERRGRRHIGTSEAVAFLTAAAGLGLLGWGVSHFLPHDAAPVPIASHGPQGPDAIHGTHDTPTFPPQDTDHIVNIPFNPGDHAGYFTMEQNIDGQWYDTITLDVFTHHIQQTDWGHGLTDDQAKQLFDLCHSKHVSANYLLATAQTFPSQYNNLGSQLGPENSSDSYPIHNADGTTSWYMKFAPGFEGQLASVGRFTDIVVRISGDHTDQPPTVQADEGYYYGAHDGGVSLGDLSTTLEKHMKASSDESIQLHPGDVIPVEASHGDATSAVLDPADEIYASLFASAA